MRITSPRPAAQTLDDRWQALLRHDATWADLGDLYAPLLRAGAGGGGFVLGRIAQTLDGRIATVQGHSFWISGPRDILHTHRLRALCDAVIVGAGTVQADDPQLTTRHCPGPSPIRVVVDTDRRLGQGHRIFQGGPPTLLLCAPDAPGGDSMGSADVLRLPRGPQGSGLDPRAIVAALAQRGIVRIFVEGGGLTVSRFLAAGVLDRLHITIAPLLLGSGIPSFTLPDVARPADGIRLDWSVYRLGEDILIDAPVKLR